MVEFLTLFLGLVSGTHEIAVSVSGPVARVELRLDGERIGRLEAPSWRGPVDLGPELLPHVLEAVGFDEMGREVARARQRINLPRPEVEASLVLDGGSSGDPTASLIWESALGEEPSELSVTLDGQPLSVVEPTRIELPATDFDDTHVLQAELRFPSGVAATAHLAFGGALIESAETDLTAIPLRWKGGGREKVGVVRRWLEPSASDRVVAIEQGSALLLVVKGPGLKGALAAFETPFDRGNYDGGLTASIGSLSVAGLDSPAVAPQANATPQERRLRALPFGDDRRARLVLPFARGGHGREIALELFAVSPELEGEGRGLLWLIDAEVEVPGLDPEPRIGDAVALAGLLASQANRRRAVLVVLGGASEVRDQSLYSLPVARRYLEALGVPLVVWRLGATSSDGSAVPIEGYRGLEKAFRDLQRSLDHQWLVWLEGSWLPAEVWAREGAPFVPLAR